MALSISCLSTLLSIKGKKPPQINALKKKDGGCASRSSTSTLRTLGKAQKKLNTMKMFAWLCKQVRVERSEGYLNRTLTIFDEAGRLLAFLSHP